MSSIRARLAFGIVAGLALLLGAGGTALYFGTRSTLERQDDAAVVSKAWALASSIEVDDREMHFEPARGIAAAFERADRPSVYELWHRDGSVYARSPSLAHADLERAAPPLNEPALAWISLPDGRPARAAWLRILVLDEPQSPASRAIPATSATPDGGGVVHAGDREVAEAGSPSPHEVLDELTIAVADDVVDTRATLAGLRTMLVAVISLAFLVSVVLVNSVLRRGLAPLDAMAAQAQSIDAESLDRRFSNEALPSELEPIRTRLNGLLDRLEQAFARERRFNAAVAHELRTPLAELRALSEIALRWPERADPEKNMGEVAAIAREMQSMIEVLLALSRVESGAERAQLEPVRVDEVVNRAIEPLRASATERNQTLRVDLAPGATIDSQPDMLRSIVANLVSNAVEYAPAGSSIEIAATAPNGRFTLSVTNAAPDLANEDLPHLFEPFWRKDPARARSSHAGLGLALTRSLAKAVDLAVRAEMRADGTLRMVVERTHAESQPT